MDGWHAQSAGPLAHVDACVAGTPGLQALLDDLAGLALEHMPALGSWAVPNILWALSILRMDALGGQLVRALLARALELTRTGKPLAPMGAAHCLWACATLRVRDAPLFEALGERLLAVSASLNHIDVSNFFWACTALGINPCGGRLLPALALHAAALAPAMSQQGVSNVLWALSKQDLGSPSNMYKMPGAPYVRLIKALLANTASLASPDCKAVNYAMTMWALGNMGFHPGQAYLRHFLACLHASGLVASFDAQNMASLAWGFARLGEHPGPELLRALRQRRAAALFAAEGAPENVQALTNVLWALCVFDELDPAFAAEVYARVPPGANGVALTQLFQASLYLKAALPPGRAPRMPPALYRACRAAWQEQKHITSMSVLQWAVLRALREAGFDVAPEYEDEFFSVDLAVFLPRDKRKPVKVAVEVDGQEHHSVNRALVDGVHQYRPLGRTVLRDKLLRAQGWAVCDVPWFEWNALKSQRDRERYLCARIALELQQRAL
jgi:hypothetical protein